MSVIRSWMETLLLYMFISYGKSAYARFFFYKYIYVFALPHLFANLRLGAVSDCSGF